MGFLDSYFRLTEMTDRMSETSDVAASLASMQSKLDALNATMTAAPAAASGARVDATATIGAVRPSGALVNGSRVIELDLLVMLPAGVPLPVTTSVFAPPSAALRVGGRLAVTLDPTQPASVAIDWQRAA